MQLYILHLKCPQHRKPSFTLFKQPHIVIFHTVTLFILLYRRAPCTWTRSTAACPRTETSRPPCARAWCGSLRTTAPTTSVCWPASAWLRWTQSARCGRSHIISLSHTVCLCPGSSALSQRQGLNRIWAQGSSRAWHACVMVIGLATAWCSQTCRTRAWTLGDLVGWLQDSIPAPVIPPASMLHQPPTPTPHPTPPICAHTPRAPRGVPANTSFHNPSFPPAHSHAQRANSRRLPQLKLQNRIHALATSGSRVITLHITHNHRVRRYVATVRTTSACAQRHPCWSASCSASLSDRWVR